MISYLFALVNTFSALFFSVHFVVYYMKEWRWKVKEGKKKCEPLKPIESGLQAMPERSRNRYYVR